ncbi:MAG: hypothetical protein HY905_02645 [Deltaproteobacteria bacterium]|nr:hypothetical protein [Deltaproteobacteria bacterium]
MPRPLAICLENLSPPSPAERYLRCVAVVGRRPGLRVDARGEVLWRSDDAVACELWVSADDRLILFRPHGAPPVLVRRTGRTLDVPPEKPVVLVDRDQVEVAARKMRVHVHGSTTSEHAPSWLPPQAAARPDALSRAAAAAFALGAVLGAAGCPTGPNDPIDVRDQPPTIAPEPQPPPPPPPIDVRETPPDIGPAQE